MNAKRIVKSRCVSKEEQRCLDGAILLEPAAYDAAVIGVTNFAGELVVVYDYEKLVSVSAKGFPPGEGEDSPEFQAMQHIDYNTVRTVEYLGSPRAPFILSELPDDVVDDDGEDDIMEYKKKRWRILAGPRNQVPGTASSNP
jgi:hypothetical protein